MMRRFTWTVAAIATLGAGWGVAFAQGGGTNPLAAPASTSTAPAAQLSPKEQLAKAESFLVAMRTTHAGVRKAHSEARAARDVVKTLCLRDKLTQINVAIRAALERRAKLKIAADKNDSVQSGTEFAICEALHGTVRDLGTQANQCIGEETGKIGASEITVDVDPEIPDVDPSEFPDHPLFSEPPLTSSPTR